jgi:hypothetical protein
MIQNLPKVNFARLFGIWSGHKISTLNDFRSTVRDSLDSERRHIDESRARLQADRANYSADEFQDYYTQLTFDGQDLGMIEAVSDELSIVALYKTTEFYLKTILVRAFHNQVKAEEIMGYDITRIKKLFKKKNIHIDSFPQFRAVDELRVLNNAIKHEDRVTSQLAKYAGWAKGDKLQNLGAAYNRIAPLIPQFIEQVSEKAF